MSRRNGRLMRAIAALTSSRFSSSVLLNSADVSPNIRTTSSVSTKFVRMTSRSIETVSGSDTDATSRGSRLVGEPPGPEPPPPEASPPEPETAPWTAPWLGLGDGLADAPGEGPADSCGDGLADELGDGLGDGDGL